MTTNASVKVDSSRRTSAPGVLLDQLVPAVFKMTSSERTAPRGAKGTRFQRLSMAINWQHEAHPTTGERLSEKVLDPDHRACQDRGMRAKIGQVIRGALEGALNQTTANDTGRAGGAGPPGSGGGWAEGNG